MDKPILDKNVSNQNLIFMVITTILVVVLIFIFVVFIALFRSNIHELEDKETKTTQK